MMSRLRQWMSSQNGSVSASNLILFTAVSMGVGSIIAAKTRLDTVRRLSEGQAQERRINESAISSASELIANGLLWYNPDCELVEPVVFEENYIQGKANSKHATLPKGKKYQIKATDSSRYVKADGCGLFSLRADKPAFDSNCNFDDNVGAAEGWEYLFDPVTGLASVRVCTKTVEKNVSLHKPVEVVFRKYFTQPDTIKPDNIIQFAAIESRPEGINPNTKKKFQSLAGELALGTTTGNAGMLGLHGGVDTCFYMRPRTDTQATANGNQFLAFSGRNAETQNSYLRLEELEPRPDGELPDTFDPKGGQYKQKFILDEPDPKAYEVMTDLRKKIKAKYLEGYRGVNEIAFGGKKFSYDEGAFLGVMPKIPNGPQFSYFLYAKKKEGNVKIKKSVKEWTDNRRPRTWQADNKLARKDRFRKGCRKSMGEKEASFCTKVYIPLDDAKVQMPKRCVAKTITLESGGDGGTSEPTPPPSHKQSRSEATRCHFEGGTYPWINKVNTLVKKRNQFNDDGDDDETTEEELAKLNNEEAAEEDDEDDDDADAEGEGHEETDEDFKWDFNDYKKKELKLALALSAFETTNEFLNHTGIWDAEGLDDDVWGELKSAYSDYDPRTDGSQTLTDGEVVSPPPPPMVVHHPCSTTSGDPPVLHDCSYNTYHNVSKTYTIWVEEPAPAPVEIVHERKVCHYFAYLYPEEPKRCEIRVKARAKGTHFAKVCRNNDGCFDEYTKIRMADGSDRPIATLNAGDYVFNPVTSRPARIEKVVIGPEYKPLVHVTVGGSLVKVTETHPFMSRHGWLTAKKLSIGDAVYFGDGKFQTVTKIQKGEVGRTVLNLALEGPPHQSDLHFLLADGVVTGDLLIQNIVDARADAYLAPVDFSPPKVLEALYRWFWPPAY